MRKVNTPGTAAKGSIEPGTTEPSPRVRPSVSGRPSADARADSPFRRVRRFVGAHQLSMFVVFALPLSWWVWLLTPGGLNPLGPAIAAFTVVALSDRDPLKRFAGQVLDVRTSPRWLAAAILIPVAVVVSSVAVNTLLGAPAPTGAQLDLWTSLPVEFLLVLILVGFGEEIGWTAFAARRALVARTVLLAFVLLASMRALWHLPLLLSGGMPVIALLGMVSFQFLVLWIYRRSGGQWVTAAIFHSVNNTVGGSFLFQMVDGQDLLRLFAVQGCLYALLALGALVFDRRRAVALSGTARTARDQEVSA